MQALSAEAASRFNLILSPRQQAQFAAYERELLEWNSRFNLTAIREPQEIRAKHFLDALSCSLAWKNSPPRRLVDVGTGAGFPGLALKILYPAMRLTLVESVGKKATFCQHMVELLEMKDVTVLPMRAEEVGKLPEHREQYDWAVARAVAALPILTEYLLPLVRVGGGMLAQKGESGPAEAQAAEKALRLLGGRLRQVISLTLPGVVEERCLVLADKISATPPQYPRGVGLAAKKPLV